MESKRVICKECKWRDNGECQHPSCFENDSIDPYDGHQRRHRIISADDKNKNLDCSDFDKYRQDVLAIGLTIFFWLFIITVLCVSFFGNIDIKEIIIR